MKNQGLFIVLVILFLLSSAGAIIGYIERNKENEPTIDPGTTAKITYVYYLEDQEVEEMPTNILEVDENGNEVENILYEYSSHTCTNKIEGTFDTESWSFKPNEVKDGTCKIYFVKAKYEVTFTATNGAVSEENEKYVPRGETGTFTIIPTEGYEFENISCTDEKEATWDPETNKITLNTVMKDVACKIDFKIKTLEMNVTVKNGKGSTTETANYGESISAIVTANTGFENPTIKCTNDQTATYEDNELTIYKITDNTTCTVTFKAVPIEEFNLSISDIPDTITVVQGSVTQKVKKNEAGSFTLKAEDGYEIDTVSCGDIVPTITDETNGKKYTFNDITKNITCTVTAKVAG